MDKKEKTRVGICEMIANDENEIKTGKGAVVEIPNDMEKNVNNNEIDER